MTIPALQAVYQVGVFILDCGNEQFRTMEGAEIPLRAQSLALLRLMVENAGHLLTRAMIMEALWSNVVVTDDSITQCVADIRRALGPNWLHLLRTIRRRGYIFEASAVRRDPAHASPVVDQGGGSRTHDTARPDERALSRAKETLHTLRSTDRRCSHTEPPVRLSVLVLPLRSLDGSEAGELLAERITGDIVTDLARYLNNLAPGEGRVFFHDNRLARWRTESRDPPADYVLRGGVQGAHRTCMSLQLLDTTDGGCIWSERCELLGQRDQIARLIPAISIVLVRDVARRIEALPASIMTPGDMVMRGKAWQQRLASPVNRRWAMHCFEAALAKDTDSVEARLGIAGVLIANVADGWSQAVRQDVARAETLLLEVLQADRDTAFPRLILGTLRRLQGRLLESRVELEMATDLAPHSPTAASQIGFTLALLGQPEAALPHMERSVRLAPHDPETPLLLNNLGMCRLLLGDIDTAADRLREATVGNPHFFGAPQLLAAALGFRSTSAEAGAYLRRAAELCPALGTLASLRTWVTMQAGPDFMPLYGHMIERGLRQAGMPEA
jgi:adenylate cyclase